MLPKRRFWKDWQKMKSIFSNDLSMSPSPNRVLTPMKSASRGKSGFHFLFILPKSSFGRDNIAFVVIYCSHLRFARHIRPRTESATFLARHSDTTRTHKMMIAWCLHIDVSVELTRWLHLDVSVELTRWWLHVDSMSVCPSNSRAMKETTFSRLTIVTNAGLGQSINGAAWRTKNGTCIREYSTIRPIYNGH